MKRVLIILLTVLTVSQLCYCNVYNFNHSPYAEDNEQIESQIFNQVTRQNKSLEDLYSVTTTKEELLIAIPSRSHDSTYTFLKKDAKVASHIPVSVLYESGSEIQRNEKALDLKPINNTQKRTRIVKKRRRTQHVTYDNSLKTSKVHENFETENRKLDNESTRENNNTTQRNLRVYTEPQRHTKFQIREEKTVEIEETKNSNIDNSKEKAKKNVRVYKELQRTQPKTLEEYSIRIDDNKSNNNNKSEKGGKQNGRVYTQIQRTLPKITPIPQSISISDTPSSNIENSEKKEKQNEGDFKELQRIQSKSLGDQFIRIDDTKNSNIDNFEKEVEQNGRVYKESQRTQSKILDNQPIKLDELTTIVSNNSEKVANRNETPNKDLQRTQPKIFEEQSMKQQDTEKIRGRSKSSIESRQSEIPEKLPRQKTINRGSVRHMSRLVTEDKTEKDFTSTTIHFETGHDSSIDESVRKSTRRQNNRHKVEAEIKYSQENHKIKTFTNNMQENPQITHNNNNTVNEKPKLYKTEATTSKINVKVNNIKNMLLTTLPNFSNVQNSSNSENLESAQIPVENVSQILLKHQFTVKNEYADIITNTHAIAHKDESELRNVNYQTNINRSNQLNRNRSRNQNSKQREESNKTGYVQPDDTTFFVGTPESASVESHINEKTHDTTTKKIVEKNSDKSSRSREPVVKIIDSESYVSGDTGDFHFSYEGEDGTKKFEKGELKRFDDDITGESVSGGYSYKDKEGKEFSLSYTADENGYRPVGDHLPTPPPIPPYIARALQYLATKTTPAPVTEPFEEA